MKKTLVISLLFAMLLVTFAPVVNAATSSTLANDLYAMGAKYGMSAEMKVRIERYLSSNPVSDEKAQAVLDKAQEVVNIMGDKTSYEELTPAQKNQVKSVATATAALLDLKIVYKGKTAEIYDKNGKLLDTIINKNGVFEFTGSNENAYLFIPVVAVIALAIGVVAKKRIVDAK